MRVTIEGAFANIGGKSYALKQITSVEVRRIPAQRAGPIMVGLAGIIIAFCAGMEMVLTLTIGLLLAVGGFGVAFTRKPTFQLLLHNAGVEAAVLSSRDRQEVQDAATIIKGAVSSV